MKTKHFLILLFALLLSKIAVGQNMSDIYIYIVNDLREECLQEGYISERDTLYVTCGFCNCDNKCFGDDLGLDNEKFMFDSPPAYITKRTYSFYSLYTPKLEKDNMIFYVGVFGVYYNEDEKVTELTRVGTKEYIFRYDRQKAQYVFKSKKMYG